jgi:hypothetical protein
MFITQVELKMRSKDVEQAVLIQGLYLYVWLNLHIYVDINTYVYIRLVINLLFLNKHKDMK